MSVRVDMCNMVISALKSHSPASAWEEAGEEESRLKGRVIKEEEPKI